MKARPHPTANDDRIRFIDRLLAWYEDLGATRYDDELNQAEHALQTAWLAREESAPPALVVAAFFHDIGHLLIDEHAGRGDFLTTDGRHETVGATWLALAFPEAVAAPVRLHVSAKRWLCTRDRGHRARLTKASERSLALQGGIMSADEAAAFEDLPYWREAVALRRWDDAAKVPGRQVPRFGAYRGSVLMLLELRDS